MSFCALRFTFSLTGSITIRTEKCDTITFWQTGNCMLLRRIKIQSEKWLFIPCWDIRSLDLEVARQPPSTIFNRRNSHLVLIGLGFMRNLFLWHKKKKIYDSFLYSQEGKSSAKPRFCLRFDCSWLCHHTWLSLINTVHASLICRRTEAAVKRNDGSLFFFSFLKTELTKTFPFKGSKH